MEEPAERKSQRIALRKGVLIGCGSLAVALGVLGMVLPLLPTTPFLLLAAYCYSKSSDRFYQWLIGNKWFGEYIRNYREGRGMQLSQKISTLALLWVTITLSWFAIDALFPRIFLPLMATGVTIHLARLPRYRPQKEAKMTQDSLSHPHSLKKERS